MIDLVHVDFNLTNGCNLSCSHCHSSSGAEFPNELTTAEIVSAVKELHSMGALSIAFAGGEPFLRPDIREILRAATALSGWRVAVITNGLLLSDLVLEWLAAECPELTVNISVDGPDALSFGLLRSRAGASTAATQAVFDRVCNAVTRTVAVGLWTSVNFTLTRATATRLPQMYDLAIDTLGAKSLVAIKFFPAGFGRAHLDAFDFAWPEWSGFFHKLTCDRRAGRYAHLQLSLPSPWEFYLPLIDHEFDLAEAETLWNYRSPLREPSYRAVRELGDVAGVHELCINGDGTIYPSVLMSGNPQVACGSVRDQAVEESWKGAPILEKLRSLTLSDLGPDCLDCGLASLCGGGSRSRALAEHGRIDAPDSYCPLVNHGLPSLAR